MIGCEDHKVPREYCGACRDADEADAAAVVAKLRGDYDRATALLRRVRVYLRERVTGHSAGGVARRLLDDVNAELAP